MSVVLPFRRNRLTAADLSAFSRTFARRHKPRRWADWELEQTEDGECDYITVMNGDGYACLTLLRDANGRYHAHDELCRTLAEAGTFEALLAELGFVEA